MGLDDEPNEGDLPSKLLKAQRHHELGRSKEAERLYQEILRIDPGHAETIHRLGLIFQSQGKFAEADLRFRQAIEKQPRIPAFHNHFANFLKDRGMIDEAVKEYLFALELKPDFASAAYNLGCTLHGQSRLKEAIQYYEKAIDLKPDFVAAYINLGNALNTDGRVLEAIRCYDRAISVEPNHIDAHYNRATAFKDKGDINGALTGYLKTLDLAPKHALAHNNLGVLFRDLGELDKALDHFKLASEIDPKHAEAHTNEAMLLLLKGEFSKGWKKYEWRRQGLKKHHAEKPIWHGDDLKGKTILLCGEQGYGDQLQFIRFAALIKQRAKKVFVETYPPLVKLFSTIPEIDFVIEEGAAAPSFDLHAPLMSLPMLLATTVESIPAKIPYLFPPQDTLGKWRALIEEKEIKVGLVWAGQSRDRHPTAEAVNRRRSIALRDFLPVLETPGVTFYSLQKGTPKKETETLPRSLSFIDHTHLLSDFSETAALISQLDLVIGVDTSVIHLAGALGKPVWVLSRFDGCWRWLENRTDTPWYPSMRLFRQKVPGEWHSVVAAIGKKLSQWVYVQKSSRSEEDIRRGMDDPKQ